jgi:HTH-like domain
MAADAARECEIEKLHAKIGQLTVERDFWPRGPADERLGPPRPDRSGSPEVSVRRQCALLGVARSSVYRPPRLANDNDLMLMRRLDELFTAWPFLSSRWMTVLLRAEGQLVNRKHVHRLMRRMGIRHSVPSREHQSQHRA